MRTLTTGRTLPTDISAHFQPMVEFIEGFRTGEPKVATVDTGALGPRSPAREIAVDSRRRVRPLFAAAVSVHRRQNPHEYCVGELASSMRPTTDEVYTFVVDFQRLAFDSGYKFMSLSTEESDISHRGACSWEPALFKGPNDFNGCGYFHIILLLIALWHI